MAPAEGSPFSQVTESRPEAPGRQFAQGTFTPGAPLMYVPGMAQRLFGDIGDDPVTSGDAVGLKGVN